MQLLKHENKKLATARQWKTRNLHAI